MASSIEKTLGGAATQAAVAQVWREVLCVREIEATQSFFDLGGDSLKAMEVIARLQGLLGVEIPLIAFFEDPTIAHLAVVADEMRLENAASRNGGAPAVSGTRAAVAKVWSEVLQVGEIDAAQNFFDLGGDSLKAMEVVSRLQAQLGVELPLLAFFEDPTVAHLTAVAEDLLRESGSGAVSVSAPHPAVEAAPATAKKAPLSFAQLMYWLLQQMDPTGHLYHQTRVVRIRGALRADVLQGAVDEICRRHEVLRTRLEAGAEEPVQVVDPHGRVEIRIEDLRRVPAEAREKTAMDAALKELQTPFNLDTDLPMRVLLVQLSEVDHLLVNVMHHVVADGQTGSIFFDELSAIYNSLAAGKKAALPALAFQYSEYAAEQRDPKRGERIEKDIEYWRSQLEGAPASLNLPTDRARPERAGHAGGECGVLVPPATVERLKALAQSSGSTLFSVVMGALRILMQRWTAQTDMVIGTVASNRTRAGADRVIGVFLNFLPLRNSVSNGESAADVLGREKQVVRDAFAHGDCPFLKIAAAAGPGRTGEESPLYNVGLLLQNYAETKFSGDGFSGEFVDLKSETALLDLRFLAEERAGGLQIDCEYKTELFDRATVQSLLAGFVGVLEAVADNPARRVSEFAISREMLTRAEAARSREQKQKLAITSTFTAEPLEAPLAFWMKELGIAAEFEFAPYNQVFQQLLDPSSLVRSNRRGFNIVLLRLTDWQRFDESASAAEAREKIERNVRELTGTLRGIGLSAPMLVCLCPVERKFAADQVWSEFLLGMEQMLASELGATAGVQVITSSQIAEFYPVEDYEDPYADRLGHIPYTPAFFTALGSMLARRIFALRSAPRKVIVLDCDNTLWKGVCGEEGPTGVVVDAPRRGLQEFMLQQIEAGMLLCLCSKNAEEDVQAVFAQNPGMALRERDIAARRVNWNSKSQNLRELAAELQLGLDSFVFIDDNPIECAEVEGQCPEVLTLLLPQNAEEIPAYLKQVWALDHWKITAEDARRTEMYRQNAEREQVRKQTNTLDDFLAGLELKLDIHAMQESDLARVSQLTERTNQFNFTTIRRNEAEVRQFVEAGGQCLTVNLSDRFGDYGLVGVILYSLGESALEIDTLLLSCRALGRRVEHNMLSRLGDIAGEHGRSRVTAKFVVTKKNQPALDFLNSVGAQFQQGANGTFLYDFPASYAASVHQQPINAPAAAVNEEPVKGQPAGSANSPTAGHNRFLARIAAQLGDVPSISRAMELERVSRHRQHGVFVAPRNAIEEMVAGVWSQLLNLDRVGIRANFFALGGHSLLATQAVARVRQTLGVELPLRAMFEAPTVAEFALRIEAERSSGNHLQAPPITRSAKAENPVLSFAQQRLWFLEQLEGGSPLYNIPQMVRMRGKLDVEALRRSLNKIAERHESLRTTFGVHDGEPVQTIAPKIDIPLPIVDVSTVAESEREERIHRLASEEARRLFDLSRGPLVRAQLLRVGTEDHVLLLTMHHIISDRWSMGVMSEELAAHYRAFASGKASPLPEMAIQYADFAAWQREWLQGEVLGGQLHYWKEKLTGAPSVLELPTDHIRPAEMSMRGATQSLILSRSLVEKLTALSQSEGVTLFMTLLAAFQTLLARYSGQDDIVVGSPIANRNFAEVEPLIGFFVNTLALRGDLSGDPSFRELVARLKEVCLQAYAHQDTPFEKLVEELQPERSLSHSPIFQVMFALQNAPMQALELPGLRLERVPVYTGTSMFDMSWFAIEVAEGLMVRAEYSTDLFEDATITRALGHFKKLLESAVAHPDGRISQLPLLPEPERHTLLAELSGSKAEFAPLCMHALVEQSAARVPQATAVISGGDRISYAELNTRANQIARHLMKLGAGPGVLVGVFMERTSDLIAALLGVLKSGAAYVPLDPSYPRERLLAILQDAKAPLVLTQESLIEELPELQAQVLALDSMRAEIAKESRENPVARVTPNELAYVLFTSGSTGRPKGVAIEHHSAATMIQWAQTVFTPAELAGTLFSTSVCFDLSIFEMFVPLSVGGKIIIVQNALFLPAAEARDEVTLINTVPSAMAELVRMKAVPESVVTVNLAGEALSPALVHEIYASTPVAKLYNLYGPTEDTTYSTYTLTRPEARVTIGRPLPNSQAYVLDRQQNPVPIGVPGELYLAGDGLARGYYGRPDLTAERFVPNPFAQRPGARMYKTGDLCRWRPDGDLEYLGRMDHQIKLRGFRIELGEIEAVLGRHDGVQQCLVMAREDTPGDRRLVAYVVAAAGKVAHEDDLRAHLKHSLPEFMLPSAFVALEQFPLTPNGKIDRKALPAPEYQSQGESYVAPQGATEEHIAAIWQKVLRIAEVGRNDNFFTLGGHSLLATQVVSRIRQDLRVELPLRTLFETATLAELSRRVDELRTAGQPHSATIQAVSRDQDLPLSFAQQRLWFLNQLEPNNPLYNVPVAIGMRGELHQAALERALREIVGRHEVLRTTFRVRDSRAVQVISPQVDLPILSSDLGHLSSSEQQTAVLKMAVEGAKETFDLAAGPLLRAHLLRLSDREHVLLIKMHHIVSDGWSMWQFIRELAELYGAFAEGKASPLPPLAIQYADYAFWQRNWMQGEVLEQHLNYWKKQLAGAATTFELPADRVRPPVQTYKGTTKSVKLSPELLKKLKALSGSEGATLFMTLLAAYQTLLYRYTGQEDVVVGTPIANRNRAEIEDLIGFFVNALVMRTDLSGAPTFRTLLQRARAVSLEAYAHQDLPFEKLVEALAPERDLSRTPLFQVWFALQNAPRSEFKLPGLELRSIEVHNGTSKFDLGLFVVEKPDGLHCMVEYSTDLFDSQTIDRFLGHFEVLLEGIAANPDQAIADLPILTPAERQQIVVDWNHTEVEYPRTRSLHQFIEEQVEKTPDAPALVFESKQLTYRELNARANQLAHHLRKMGVGQEVLVGICAERSLEMVIGLLGIVKAGGAYVPLDPDHPRDRLAAVIEDAAPPVLLTQEHLLDVLPAHNAPVICLDRDWNLMSRESTTNPKCITTGKDQAYAIFTSGSTGKPKGVPNVHEGIVNRLLWMQHAYGLNGSDRVLQKTPYSFDVSVWEFFWPLMTGACLVVAKPEGHKDPNYIRDLIQQQKITTLHFVPSMLRIFLEAEGVEKCSSLRRVICSGEALPLEVQQTFFERLKAELHNLYGPTEAAVDVTYWQCIPDYERSIVPIGRPIWNTQIYILDPKLQPVPIGIPGELHIGGVGLARGYLNRPQLTAEKFIRDPFSTQPGARLYKTGDLCRFLPDGNIEYLGRIDHQVKIRGFRIELGEIESTLDKHPGVRQSVVMAREDTPGDKRLVAYVVPDTHYRGPEGEGSEDMLTSEQVSQWAMTFDEAYQRGGSAEDATFNIVGWNSSYTNQPIPAEEMRVWVETTVERILALEPKKVWEIGCGTGLLLFRVAPRCVAFHGTDVSQRALDFLTAQMQRPGLQLPQVTLDRKPAHDFSGRNGEKVDAIVINSVIQYFPDLEYLVSVLTGAIDSVCDGGSVFIGDVRHFALLETFHTSVQLHQAAGSLPCPEMVAKAKKNMRQEGELLVDPEFFSALQQRLPRISRIEINLKRGRAHNELTRFRYDVVLHVGDRPAEKLDCPWLDWNKQGLTTESLREVLTKTRPDVMGVTGVPNARLQGDAAAMRLLASGAAPASVGELREAVEREQRNAIEPEDLWALGNDLPYDIEIRSSRTPGNGLSDVVVWRKTGKVRNATGVLRFPGESSVLQPLETYANNPLRQRIAASLAPELRRWLAGTLPEYMVPQHFVLLDTMPLSANGKADRKALPAPDQSRVDDESAYVAPSTPTEELLASIWAEVLRIERAGVTHDFFELGGHSLSATQVVARIRQAFQVELPLRTLFESPTIRGLAAIVDQSQRGELAAAAPPIVAVSRDQEIPLSFAQQRLWFLDQMDPGNPLYNVPRTIRMKGTMDVEALRKALNDLVARHEVLRTRYVAQDSHPVQKKEARVTLEMPVIEVSGRSVAEKEEEARRVLQAESVMRFDLASGPVLDAKLYVLGAEDHILFLNTHHIASDGWSTGVLLNDLAALYQAAKEKVAATLPELEIQYADYAYWQRNWLQGEVLDQQLAYWRQQLEGAPPVLSLPTDRARPATQTFRGAMYEHVLPRSLADAVRVLSRQQGATPFMTMLASFDSLLHYLTGQEEIVVGTDMANRTSVKTESLIGFFVNLLVMRLNLGGNPSFEQLMARAREMALGAYAHQDVPFDKLVEELRPERNLSHSPLVQVLFVQQNTPRSTSSFPGLEISRFKIEVESKFDMAVFVSENAQEIASSWVYNPDLFDHATIARMAANFELALRTAVAQPKIKLDALCATLAGADKQQRESEQKKFEETGLAKLKKIRRKAIEV